MDSGSIKIDGLDLRDLKQHDFRKLIGFIPQEAHLFNDSIRENLLLGKPDATDESIFMCKIETLTILYLSLKMDLIPSSAIEVVSSVADNDND